MYIEEARQLADELNLITSVPLRTLAAKVDLPSAKFAFVIDFESTCWSKVDVIRHPEITEFPCVVVDMESGTTIKKFHHFVRPTEHPQLSEFCTKLTNITQAQVDQSPTIAQVWNMFCDWLKNTQSELGCAFNVNGSSSAVFVTWSDWDIGKCLKNELRRKGLSYNPWLECRFDLRRYFRQLVGSEWRGNFCQALRHVGLTFTGRPHTGLDDALNTGKMMFHLKTQNIEAADNVEPVAAVKAAESNVQGPSNEQGNIHDHTATHLRGKKRSYFNGYNQVDQLQPLSRAPPLCPHCKRRCVRSGENFVCPGLLLKDGCNFQVAAATA